MAATVTAATLGSWITITSTETTGGIITTSKISKRKNQCYSNITGTGTAPVFSIIDDTGTTIFTRAFTNDTQVTNGVTHSLNGDVLFSTIWAAFNTWNAGVGAAKLLTEKVYIAQLTQSSTSAPTYTVVKNTLGSALAFAYSSAGVYNLTIGTLFDKTKASYSCGGGVAGNNLIQLGVTSDALTITTSVTTTGTATNGLMTATPIAIRVQH